MSQKVFGIGNNVFETHDTEFDLFSKPVLNSDSYSWNDYIFKPKNPIQNTDHNPVTFEIGGDDCRNYTLLPSIRVDGQVKVVHSDNTDLDPDEEVSVSNIFPHALFQSIDIKINNTPVSDHARLYPHRAYIHALYSYSKEVKDITQLAECYFEDNDRVDEVVDVGKKGFIERKNLIKESRTCYISFVPKIDTLSITRYFPPGHTISFEFIRSPSHFALQAPNLQKSYKIQLIDLTLRCRQLLPTENIETRMRKLLSVKDIHLPVTRLVARSRSLHAGLYDGTISNAISGKTPNHMMVFFLKNSQINGDLTADPFFFGRHDLREACVVINGQSFPSEKLRFNEVTGDYFNSYNFFMENIGCSGDVSNGIKPSSYMKDCFSLAFDLTPDTCLNNHLHSHTDSTIDIKLVFEKPLPTPITVLYISTYDNIISLSPDKSVSIDYTV